ncbi:hypothetical protein GW796_09770 [archaeon]|nr:hypothetical protein [archaeon]
MNDKQQLSLEQLLDIMQLSFLLVSTTTDYIQPDEDSNSVKDVVKNAESMDVSYAASSLKKFTLSGKK